MSKLLTVFGATGNQGGSVIKTVLEHPELSKKYKIRAVTRDVSKPAVTTFKEQGVEIVTADLNDKESVFKAVKGSSVVFGVTNFWEVFSKDTEVRQGHNIVDAAKAANVERLIWSSLVHVTKATNGRISSVAHFDGKAEVEEYARSMGVPGTYFMPAMFMSNIVTALQKGEKEEYALNLPFSADLKVPLLDPAADSGLFVAAILLNPEETLNKRIAGASGNYTISQLVEDFTAATGHTAKLNTLPMDMWASFLPKVVREELKGNFELIIEPGYYVNEDADIVNKSLELVKKSGLRKPISFEEYVAKNFEA